MYYSPPSQLTPQSIGLEGCLSFSTIFFISSTIQIANCALRPRVLLATVYYSVISSSIFRVLMWA
ncbi:hypothetical protein FB446DRAFT_747750 [Lentinula raphanica]|nr:hypothetical protein FB446DRAFT_747750 [Lentinula raphanica]